MFNLQFEEPYLSQAQEIMGKLCTEVVDKGPKMIDILMDFLDKVNYHTKGLMQISKVDFGDELMPETPVAYSNKHQAGLFGSVMGAENSALMISAERGTVVHCFSYIQVGDKEYVTIMNPQTAQEIRNAMQGMVDNLKENDQTKQLEQLTIWDKICDFFAQLFKKNQRGEAVGRAEAYRNFYEGMQKHMDMLTKVEQASIAQNFERRHEYDAAVPNAEQIEEIHNNIENVQQPENNLPKEELPKSVEEQIVDKEQIVDEEQIVGEEQIVEEEQQVAAEPKEPGRRIETRWVNLNAEKQKLNPQEQSLWVEEVIDLDALDEEIAREKEAQEKEELRKYEEAVQKRNEALNAKAERVAGYRKEIKDLQEKIDLWEPKYLKTKARVDDLNGKLSDLNKYDMTHGGKYEKQRLLNARETLETEIKKIDQKMSHMNESKKAWDRKEAAERNIDTTKNAIEQAKLKLKDVEGDLRSADIDLQYWSGMGQRNGAWMKPEEFLENQYKQDKAKRDQKYNEEQKARSEKITELEKELAEYQKVAKNHSKQMGWFSKTDEQKNEQAVYDNYVKTTKEALSNLRKEDALAKKTYDNEEKAKKKELLSPSKDLLEKTAGQLREIKTKCDAALSKYNSVATNFDLAKQNVIDKEEDHQKALNYYKDNFEGKTFKFDSIGYMSLENEKSRLGRELDAKNHEISMFEANVATFDASKKALLDAITPIEGPNADLQLSLKVWKLNLQEAKDKLAQEENTEIAPLNMKDPRKKDGPVMGGGMG